MPALRVLVAPDKFKGTLTAPQAAAAIAAGWHESRPYDQLDLLPSADGGDGFGEALRSLVGARPRSVKTCDAAGRPCRVQWWFDPVSRTAIIESARVIGLALLPPGAFHIFLLDTFGLGAVLQAAARAGARSCLVGIGGSATNDGGFGLACALGWQFLDTDGAKIAQWTGLRALAKAIPPAQNPLGKMRVIVATDVRNKLLGPLGATPIYGPQKGIRPQDIPVAESALKQLAKVMHRRPGRNLARLPGSGAAGGLGFGSAAFARAELQPGFDLFSRLARLSQRLSKADLVLTGEGALDGSTLMGKGVGEIARLSRRHRLPCIGLAGTVVNPAKLDRVFSATHAIVPHRATLAQSMARPAEYLRTLARDVAAGVRR